MVTIRLTRRGGKKEPFYHVVVTDSRKRQGGTTLELVGFYNPVARGKETVLRLEVDKIDALAEEGRAGLRTRRRPAQGLPQAGGDARRGLTGARSAWLRSPTGW